MRTKITVTLPLLIAYCIKSCQRKGMKIESLGKKAEGWSITLPGGTKMPCNTLAELVRLAQTG
jgi:hypothetical protein